MNISTTALESSSQGDQTYSQLNSQLACFASPRNHLASQMIGLLEGAEFDGQRISPQQTQYLVSQANSLIQAAISLASGGSSVSCP
ncbi:MAG TPA: hypothetical protein VFF30_12830 [Nitrososphaerales archaeon]|nr:hypothetical protein [Nitrososphaerales archaeon]